MLAQSELFELLQQIDRDFLGVVLLIGTIGFFVTLVVSIVTITRAFQNIALTRMNHSMVTSLLAQGYSIEDVERLAQGHQNWGAKFRKMVHSAKSGFSRMHGHPSRHSNQPMPPWKQTT